MYFNVIPAGRRSNRLQTLGLLRVVSNRFARPFGDLGIVDQFSNAERLGCDQILDTGQDFFRKTLLRRRTQHVAASEDEKDSYMKATCDIKNPKYYYVWFKGRLRSEDMNAGS